MDKHLLVATKERVRKWLVARATNTNIRANRGRHRYQHTPRTLLIRLISHIVIRLTTLQARLLMKGNKR
jgi:hypothetical protein